VKCALVTVLVISLPVLCDSPDMTSSQMKANKYLNSLASVLPPMFALMIVGNSRSVSILVMSTNCLTVTTK
jgi:hypothetical protein